MESTLGALRGSQSSISQSDGIPNQGLNTMRRALEPGNEAPATYRRMSEEIREKENRVPGGLCEFRANLGGAPHALLPEDTTILELKYADVLGGGAQHDSRYLLSPGVLAPTDKCTAIHARPETDHECADPFDHFFDSNQFEVYPERTHGFSGTANLGHASHGPASHVAAVVESPSPRCGLHPAGRQTITPSALPTANRNLLQCHLCNDLKIYRRRYELERHMKKHEPKQFFCPVPGCPRLGNHAFYRKDKMKAHLIQGHKMSREDATAAVAPF